MSSFDKIWSSNESYPKVSERFKIDIGEDALLKLLCLQVSNLFFLESTERKIFHEFIPIALGRLEICFSASENKYYSEGGVPFFSPYHSGQYCIFLYYFANTVFHCAGEVSRSLCDKLYFLNKALNCIDLYYEVEMPKVFALDHPVGSVMGRAKYGERFSFSQNCTVGNNKGIYPKIEKNVKMMSGAKILGKSYIGENSIISANTYIKDETIPDNSMVFGQTPNLVIKGI
nr:hypothetical protein [uncultured Roseovarius sp.]